MNTTVPTIPVSSKTERFLDRCAICGGGHVEPWCVVTEAPRTLTERDRAARVGRVWRGLRMVCRECHGYYDLVLINRPIFKETDAR